MTPKRRKVINILWRVYFYYFILCWIIFIFSLAVFPALMEILPGTHNIWLKIVDLVIQLIAIIGLFAYIYQKRIFRPVFWKTFFCVFLIYEFADFLIMALSVQNFTTFFGWWLIVELLLVPLVIAVFLYAFKSKIDENEKSLLF